jgi:NAD(P)H-flavin reductase
VPPSPASPPTSPPARGRLAPDIDAVPPRIGSYPVSRLAPERKLQRVDRYDRRAEVTAYETLTSTGTVRVSFKVVDDQPFELHPGYFVGIQAEVAGFGRRRSPYCIVSPPNEDRTFQLLVRLVPEGPLSIYLASLEVGNVIAFRGPSGRSMVPKKADEELILIATGVGVGPFLALVEHLKTLGFDRPIRLYWGLRLAEDICLVEELESLRQGFENFTYQISLSQPSGDWTGLRGRVTETVPQLVDTLGGKRYYLVGNGAMISEMSTVLSDLGVDIRLIYEEVYFNVKHRPDPEVLKAIRNRFVASDLFSPFSHQEANLFMPERVTRSAASPPVGGPGS